MCGIAGIFSKNKSSLPIKDFIFSMYNAIKHRGLDGNGFILGNYNGFINTYSLNSTNNSVQLNFLPKANLVNAENDNEFALAHARLSIIDLSETGHQPMCSIDNNYWITFNGEIYNYIEIKNELKNLGYIFFGHSDTEVVLNAYKEWGENCLHKFNGMWAFAILNLNTKTVFASRDRFGVKPFYYINNKDLFAFASEQKAFVKSKLIEAKASINHQFEYLINTTLENDTANFFEGINELLPGHNLHYNIKTHQLQTKQYYCLSKKVNLENNDLSDQQLTLKIQETLFNAIKLRLRSDVEVGTCLSGGIDSSAISVIMQQFMQKPLNCFTAQFKNTTIDESNYATLITNKINANHNFVEPTVSSFEREVKTLVYSQDVPIWSTSTYAQFKVMELAKQHQIKVVLDGQGADELFAGYHHHFVAQWLQLLKENKLAALSKALRDSKISISNPNLFFIKDLIKSKIALEKKSYKIFFKADFIALGKVDTLKQFNEVNLQLLYDIETKRLKSFLKCEDRCGMWHGVESRTPFSDDINLIELMFSFDGKRKIKNGVSKYFLREAVKDLLPQQIYTRYDKKGFETPQLNWIQQIMPKMVEQIKAANFEFLKNDFEHKLNLNKTIEQQLVFKLYVLAIWKEINLLK